MFRSFESRLIIFFAVISIGVSILKNINLQAIIAQIIIYYLVARNSDCLIYGNCKKSAHLSIIIPIIGIFVFLLDYIGYLNIFKENFVNTMAKINRL
jgi:hypothetical protein